MLKICNRINLINFSKETLQQKRKEKSPNCIEEDKIKYRVRGPSLVLRSSVLSMFSLSRLSVASEVEEM